MKIAGLNWRLYRIEDKVMVSDFNIFDKKGKQYLTSDNPIKDSFKLYIKRKQHKLSKK